MNFSNGSSFDMRRRERPQLLLSDSGQPRLFSTGVEDFEEHTYTLVMRVNSQKGPTVLKTDDRAECAAVD